MWPGYMYRSPQTQNTDPVPFPEHSVLASAKNPSMRFDVRELFRELERDYGSDGKGLNFGPALMPIFREARIYIPAGTEVTVSQFNEILRHTSSFDFIQKTHQDRSGAVNEVVQMAKRLGAVK